MWQQWLELKKNVQKLKTFHLLTKNIAQLFRGSSALFLWEVWGNKSASYENVKRQKRHRLGTMMACSTDHYVNPFKTQQTCSSSSGTITRNNSFISFDYSTVYLYLPANAQSRLFEKKKKCDSDFLRLENKKASPLRGSWLWSVQFFMVSSPFPVLSAEHYLNKSLSRTHKHPLHQDTQTQRQNGWIVMEGLHAPLCVD